MAADFRELLRLAEERSFWAREQMDDYQAWRLGSFLSMREGTRCTMRVREWMSLGRCWRSRWCRSERADFIARGLERGGIQWAHTSGTTGAGLRFPVTRRAHQEQWAIWWRYRRWHGIGIDTWCGYFGGRMIVPLQAAEAPYWRDNAPGRQILFSGQHLREETLPAYVAELRRRQPPWLHGYPSLLALVADYLVTRGEDLGYAVRVVDDGRGESAAASGGIARTGVRGAASPALRHGGGGGEYFECEQGRLHIDEDFSVVEFLPAEEPDVYRVVGTNFTNLAMPLVRYDVGDRVRLSLFGCPCGRPGRVVESIDGRSEDYLWLGDKYRGLGRLDHIFKDATRIREAQIVQRARGEMTLRVVRGVGFAEDDERQLLAETRYRVGAAMRVDLEYVDRIERTATGKLRLVVSEVA